MRTLLERQSDLIVVGEGSDARQAYSIVEKQHPDVVVVDIGLPGVDGICATRELRRREPDGKILVLSVHESQDWAAEAIAAGARGYALKSQPSDVVVSAIRTVGRGDTYLPPEFPATLLDVRMHRKSGGDPLFKLSMREREVFALLTRGFTNQSVGDELCISVKTVETHRSRIHRKLNLHSVAELIRYAALNGLLRD
jgi:DNA-binding NarL/FixJ family response regulator